MKKSPFGQWFMLTGRDHARARSLLVGQLRLNRSGADLPDAARLFPARMGAQEAFYNRLLADRPHYLSAVGLDHPVTVIERPHDGHPRAYQEWPTTYVAADADRNPKFFVFSPFGHDGKRFRPKHAVKVSARNIYGDFGYMFNKTYGEMEPVFYRRRTGAEVPVRYRPGRISPGTIIPAIRNGLSGAFNYAAYGLDGIGFLKPLLPEAWARAISKGSFAHQHEWGEKKHTRVSFLAGGRTEEYLDDLRQRRKAWQESLQTLTSEIEQIVRIFYLKDIKKTLPPGEDVNIQCSYRYADKPGGAVSILLSARRKGLTDPFSAGRPVAMENTGHYVLEPQQDGEYVVRHNPHAERGIYLRKLFEAVPEQPHIGDYPELKGDFTYTPATFIDPMLGINGQTPRERTLHGYRLLVYNTDVNPVSTFCPPGCTPVSTATLRWLDGNEADKNVGVRPPLMPHAVWKETQALPRPSSMG